MLSDFLYVLQNVKEPLFIVQSYEFIYIFASIIDVWAYFIDECRSSGEPPSRRPAGRCDTMKNTILFDSFSDVRERMSCRLR